MKSINRFSQSITILAIVVGSLVPVTTKAQDSAAFLEEIIVTAARRAESIQDSSLIIEAFNTEKIVDQGIDDMVDLSSVVPSLQIGLAGPQLQMFIRGVGSPNATIVGSPAIALSKDGTYLARTQSVHGAFFDLERIEVLKGPQGTLYGRNATGGAVNLITVAPEIGATGGYLQADVGNFSKVHIEGAINIPMGDSLATRLSAISMNRDGYMSDDTMDDQHYAVRLQTLWEPSDKVSWRFQGQYADYGGRGLGGFTYAGASDAWESIYPGGNDILLANLATGPVVPSVAFPWITDALIVGPAPTPPFPPGTNLISGIRLIGDTADQELTTWDVGFRLDVDLDWATLTVQPSYQEIESFLRNTPGPQFQIGDPFNGLAPETSEATTLEVRLAGESDRLQWVAGVYLFDEDQFGPTRVNQGPAQNLYVENYFETESLGIFAETTFNVSDQSRLIVGARYSDDDIVKPDFIRWSVTPAFDCPPGAPNEFVINGVTACQVSPPTTESASFDSFDWNVVYEYDLSDDSMMFLKASTGYKAGGLSAVAGAAFGPEELDAYELGFRNLFMDGRLQVNGDIFFWDYKDRQENIVGPDELGIIGQATVNAGETSIQGIGVDVLFAASDRDLIRVGAEFLDAEYDSFTYNVAAPFLIPSATCPESPTGNIINLPPPFGPVPEFQIDCTGFEATRSPRLTWNVAYTHTFELASGASLDATIDGSYKDEVWTTATFLTEQRAPDLTLWNARLTYNSPSDAFKIVAYVTNISDDASFSSGLNHTQIPQLVGLSPTNPRTYGLRLRRNF
ncbi:MAG: TonB-dependent receptor [Pseudomonadota bacterium]